MPIHSGARIFVESLLREKVEVVFGYPGGKVIPLYDELYDAPIKHILVRHEQGAAHAADGYARSTGKVGVCIATSGPGATNLVTGLATAYMDSVPVVAFTGQAPTSLIGTDSFQEIDIRGITLPVTKHNYLVTNVKDLAKTIKEAFYIARTGRPGPVLVDLPVDVLKSHADFMYPQSVNLPGYQPTYEGNYVQIKLAAEAINTSERPVIFAGGGVINSNASEQLTNMAIKGRIPVVTSLMGLGTFPEDHELSLKMLGMHGTIYANYAISEADLIIGIGVRFDDRVTGKLETFAPYAKIIHIDIDPAEVNKNVKVDIPIVGNAKNVLDKLIPLIKTIERKEWLEKIKEWKRRFPLNYEYDDNSIKPQYLIEKLDELCDENTVIVTEVGQNQMWAAQYFHFSKPRSFITSGGLGTMGYGLPASMGVQVGNPDKTVINISGDGSFQMNLQELATISSNRLPVKIIILNNGTLGMVRQWQELFFDERYSSTILENPDFVKLAQAYGIKSLRIDQSNDVEMALKEVLNYNGPVLLDVIIPQDENVFPMVPEGASINEMLELKKKKREKEKQGEVA
ncbi:MULTISPECIES: biosynthetic-type acetolactate synthase large subunit [Petrotoga]|uniref:Acetolactate synthase n=2 Tax=Petrotoga sibirica TaxID=156202 RepID=A0A4V3GP77_9BACT|nr:MULTISPECIES: biosynthetic-type acetolactate synthase large subunit [Petrotoga]POZ87977.1 acetolactate synthase catalytic subunit [Petrotoga sibirica DSM 13575]POZ90255.1 acetolactate synthase catalytic subunit [Petrotoga sp. SL27]TDX10163.1 acetolactate synthase large subunit [Petrotoga sibirica]